MLTLLICLVGTLAYMPLAGAVSYQDLQDVNRYTLLFKGDSVETYVENGSLGYIEQYHPYYATRGRVYLLERAEQKIFESNIDFYYNVSFSGAYYLSRLNSMYTQLPQELAMEKMYALKKKDSGIKMTSRNAVVYDMSGQALGTWNTYKQASVPVRTPLYKTADAMYRYVFGTNFDSQMP